MNGEIVLLSSALLSSFTVELLKFLFRRFVYNDPEYDFPTAYYAVVLPLVTFVWSVLLGLAGWGEPVAFEWSYFLNWLLAVAVTIGMYHLTLRPIKAQLNKASE